ncbi:MAG: ATP-binding cassette domain-containing protein [Alphaproteobacteria bacterium]|nr:ATP-binding cassette domain-containing protein [Alphaproteobacteria bacterium]
MTDAPTPGLPVPVAKIAVRGLRKAFGAKQVLRGLDLEVVRGESLVVIGSSGSGKSVLIKTIMGLIDADEGSIRVDGEEVLGLGRGERARVQRKFGMLFQGAALFDSLPVWENVAFGPLQGGRFARTRARRMAVDALAQVGIARDAADRLPAELSGGMQKRVGLARAIATRPEIVFFDEPTTGLDPVMGAAIDRLIRHVVTSMGVTAVTITHDMACARRIADRVAMIFAGHILWAGPVADLDRSGNPYVDQFVNGRTEGPIRPGARD